MYCTIIELKKNITGDALAKLKKMAEDAFSNRAGNVKNISKESHRLVFEGERRRIHVWIWELQI